MIRFTRVVTPRDARFVWGGYYEESSLIWHSRWVTTDAVIECREALAFPGQATKAVILRRVNAVHGRARLAVRLQVAAGYGRSPMRHATRAGTVWTATSGPVCLRWHPGSGMRQDRGGELSFRLDLDEGDERDLVLELSASSIADGPPDPASLWSATEDAWRHAVPSMDGLPARRDAAHAYAVMRGLTTAGGGMVAAATMSLPERAEAGRNYDYRYTWIRDQCFAGQAAATVRGGEPLLDGSVRFVAERLRADGPELKPAYRTTGDPVPGESDLPHLPGYPGGQVKVGNRANDQFQLDALGESLLLLAAAGEAGVRHCIDILAQELRMTMALCGARSIAEIDGHLLRRPGS